MIKMVNFVKNKGRIVLIIGFICTVVLGSVLLTGGLTKPSSPQNPTIYNAEVLFKNKTAYVGDNSKVVAIIDNAVSLAIRAQRKSYFDGEVATEGHIILDTEEKNGTVKAYTIASFGAFGFENGIFTKVSGSGAIPTVMIFSKKENDEYDLLEYKEPEDGAGYLGSIKKMFPHQLQDKVLSAQDDYSDLIKQQEEQAAEYLKSIGMAAKVSAAHVEKELVDINVQASNKLFAEFTKYDSFLNNCPYWVGTRERIENGVRYIYETSQSKTNDGYDLITFRKAKEDGTVVEEQKYKIIGSEPQLID